MTRCLQCGRWFPSRGRRKFCPDDDCKRRYDVAERTRYRRVVSTLKRTVTYDEAVTEIRHSWELPQMPPESAITYEDVSGATPPKPTRYPGDDPSDFDYRDNGAEWQELPHIEDGRLATVPDSWRPKPRRDKGYVEDSYQSPNVVNRPVPRPRRRTFVTPRPCDCWLNGVSPQPDCSYCMATIRPDPLPRYYTPVSYSR